MPQMNNSDWITLDTGVASAEENMHLDAKLLQELDSNGPAILHFYSWSNRCATYGHFVKPGDFLNLREIEKRGIQLAKRPTGGGIVFHIWDLAFSVLIPENHNHFAQRTLDNYHFINQRVLLALQDFFEEKEDLHLIKNDLPGLDASCRCFCMAQPTKYDLVVGEKKIAGAAQRKRKRGLLHQGTISLKIPEQSDLEALIHPGSKVLEAILNHSFPLLAPNEDLEEGRQMIKIHLEKAFTGT